MCINPRLIVNRTNQFDCFKPLRLTVPCGHCYECRNSQANEWFIRSYYEWKDHSRESTYFYTLTHSEDTIDKYQGFRVFSKTKVVLFVKRLRSRLFKMGITLKYVITCEYGETTHRPHYHAIFFLSSQLPPYHFYQIVNDTWQYGFVMQGKFNQGLVNSPVGLHYVCKYISKKDDFLNTFLPDVVPPIYRRWRRVFDYLRRRYNLSLVDIQMNPETFAVSIKKLERHPLIWETLDYRLALAIVRKIRSFYSKFLPFHLQSQKLGISAIDSADFTNETIVYQSFKGQFYTASLPRYFKRKFWYDLDYSPTTGKRTSYVLNEKGKQHLFDRMSFKINRDVQEVSSSLDRFLKMSDVDILGVKFKQLPDDVNVYNVVDIKRLVSHLRDSINIVALSVYRIVFRNRLNTLPIKDMTASDLVDNWQDYASACIFDRPEHIFGQVYCSSSDLQYFDGKLWNNLPTLSLYERFSNLVDEIQLFLSKMDVDFKIFKSKREKALRDLSRLCPF